MNKKIYLIIIVSIFSSTIAFAQGSLDIHFNGMGFMDNREYKDYISRSNTYSGTRLALDLGLNLDSNNHFIVGINGLHEFGSSRFMKVDPVAYYNYTNKNWNFNIGAFSREGLLSDYPRALLNDTLRYYRPNVQGMLLKYQNEHFTETVWIDWLSKQSPTDREQFLVGLSGKYRPVTTGPFYVTHYFQLMHNAYTSNEQAGDHIEDNGGLQVKLGLDFSHKTILDSLTIEAGALMSIERIRNVTDLNTPKGFVASAYLGYKRFALYDEFYKGQGSHINYGDGFYQNKTYNRLDLMYTPLIFKNIRGSFVFSLHNTPSRMSSQQAFRLTFDLGRKVLTRF